MNNLFQSVAGNRPKKNAFDLSHEKKFSMKMGTLTPILCEEILPGDSWRVNTEVLMRFAPMLAPLMHRVNVFTHFFFVPNRLIWEDWEKFITGGEDGTLEPIRPYRTLSTAGFGSTMVHGSLADHLGFNTGVGVTENTSINILPFRAYLNIYNEYYRDQNLEDEIVIDKSSGADSTDSSILNLRTRAWEKDYFTSALPWTQRGGDVSLPLTGSAPVGTESSAALQMAKLDNSLASAGDIKIDAFGDLQSATAEDIKPMNLEADMSGVTAATVEELRRATKLQTWLEKNARGGARYIEQILMHFGVISSDQRLQRPEFLGGGKTPVVVSEVLQTSSTDATTPQGNPAGHGLAAGNSHRISKSFEEHGYIIGIMSVLPKTAYQQGTRKHLKKDDKFDYFFPDFAQLGEQPVLLSELYDNFDAASAATFGYQSRYAEYKYIPSSVHGSFKDDLSFWHAGRIFSSAPALNKTFVKADTQTINTRIFAAGDTEDQLWVQCYNNIKALRPIPKINNPSLI